MHPDTARPETPVIGYVLKMYPRFSETFVVSEILAREAAGEQIVIFSLRPPIDSRFHAELARVEAPVIQIPRTSNAGRLWRGIHEVAETSGLHSRLSTALPELLKATADEAYQAIMLAQATAEHGVTHLHAHFASVSTTVARLAGKITDLPYSFTAHAKDIFHEDIDPDLLERKLAEAHHAVTISQYNVSHLHRQYPQHTDKVRLVRNGLNLERFPFVPRATTSEPVPRILAVGRLVEKKGFGLLIEAVAALRDQGVEVHADIAGDGPLTADLHQQIHALSLQDRVRLLGPRTQAEVTDLMGTHDVFAAPFVIGADGNADGLPTVLLEAMARGIRCVAADVTAVGEVIRNASPGAEATGWLVPSGDVEALAEALQEAVTATDHTAMTSAARALVEQQFDSHRQAAQLRALVQAPMAEVLTDESTEEYPSLAAAPLPVPVRAAPAHAELSAAAPGALS